MPPIKKNSANPMLDDKDMASSLYPVSQLNAPQLTALNYSSMSNIFPTDSQSDLVGVRSANLRGSSQIIGNAAINSRNTYSELPDDNQYI